MGSPVYVVQTLVIFGGSDTFPATGVGEAVWAFMTKFEVTEQESAAPNVDLVFDGLDTYATIELVSIVFLKVFLVP